MGMSPLPPQNQPKPVSFPGVTLTDDMLRLIGRKPDVVREFPSLRHFPGPVRGGCKCNASAANRRAEQDQFNAIKLTIKGLAPDRLALLKRMLSVTKLTLFVREASGIKRYDL